MNQSENRFIFNTTLALAIGAMIVAGLLLSSWTLAERTRVSFETVIAERDIRRTSVDLLSMLRSAESGQRGFLLTGDRDFLEPYQVVRLHLEDKRNDLARLVEDRPTKRERMAELTRLFSLKVAEMDKTLKMSDAGDKEGAIRIVLNESGLRQMEEIRVILDSFIQKSDENIDAGVASQLATTDRLRIINIAGAIAIMVLLATTAYTIARHIKALTHARQELETLNQVLESRVAERTEDLMRANQEVHRYAYIVSHDLRAPLVNVMGFTAELAEALEPLRAYVLADGNTVEEQDILKARQAVIEDIPEALTFIRSSSSSARTRS